MVSFIYVGNRTVSDAKLEPGNVSDTVTITADAPQLQSTTTEVGGPIGGF